MELTRRTFVCDFCENETDSEQLPETWVLLKTEHMCDICLNKRSKAPCIIHRQGMDTC